MQTRERPSPLGSRRARPGAVAAMLAMSCCMLSAGCGGSGATSTGARTAAATVAQRVCGRAQRAAAAAIGGAVTLRVADSDATDIECLLGAGGRRLDVVAQAAAQAWGVWGTIQVHQVQAYGSGAAHEPAQIPKTLPAPRGVLAAWIPAKRELFATNGTETRGGSFVTVTITRGRQHGQADVRLAQTVTLAALSVAPRGPSSPPPA